MPILPNVSARGRGKFFERFQSLLSDEVCTLDISSGSQLLHSGQILLGRRFNLTSLVEMSESDSVCAPPQHAVLRG